MKGVLERGGDTDTNLAIVGGLLGTLVGFTNLPPKYL
jgi:ADP-ribosylglycohydrolase